MSNGFFHGYTLFMEELEIPSPADTCFLLALDIP